MTRFTGKDFNFANVIAASRKHPRTFVEVERANRHAIVRLAEPELLNPLSPPLLVQLIDRLNELAGDPDVNAVILTGTDPGFCVGGDFRLMQSAIEAKYESEEGATAIWRAVRYLFGKIARTITGTDKAFIAAVNGQAAGVGLAFALACDLIVCSERALLVPAFGRLGLVPEVGTSWLLTRRLGYQGAFDFYTCSEHISGARAREIGIANDCVAHDELIPHAVSRAAKIAEIPDHALAMSKALLRQCADMTWEQAVTMEEFAEPMTFTTGHFQRVISSLHPDSTAAELPGWPLPEEADG